MPLPDPIIEVLTVFRPLFTAPTWRKLMILLTGTPLTRGQRTVAAALRATGNEMAGVGLPFDRIAGQRMLSAYGESPV